VAKSPGDTVAGRYYPRCSLVLVDELATADGDDLNTGLGWTVPILSEAIIEMCQRWGVRPKGMADDAIFAQTGSSAGSIADEFRRCGVSFSAAKKGSRVAGWEKMKRLLQDAGKPDNPGLYISRRCGYWWETVPYLARDKKRTERRGHTLSGSRRRRYPLWAARAAARLRGAVAAITQG
jgi:hypothetical protein